MIKTTRKNQFKVIAKILFVATLFIFTPQQAEAQFLKKLAKKAKAKVEREAEKRAERRVNKKIDKEFDKAEDVLDGKKKGSKKDNNNSDGNQVNDSNADPASTIKKPNVSWSRFDFVSGDTVIFEDLPGSDEENGEFPSRWDLYKGGAEIAEVDGKSVIRFITDIGNMHSKGIVPYLKNAKEDYLPEVFTIEFDAFFNPSVNNERYYVTLHDRKNQSRSGISQITIFVNQLSMGTSEGTLVGKNRSNRDEIAGWRHISIAYTKGKLKAYLEDQRLINIPHLEGNPTGVTLSGGSEGMYIKNIRFAKGGVKYYDRVLSEGKIIVNGIKFDTNKATLKPESMGPINKIYQIMQKQPDLNFSVEGHTDSDGNDANNQTLSEARGKAVMNKLIEMGISANRLKSTGFGESKPIDNNSTPEGKANNRRVEFVKFQGNSQNNSANSNSIFNTIDMNMIETKIESLPESFNIPISNNSGIINGQGTVIIYATSDGDLGKMEILDVDKNDGYNLTVRYVTYNRNGSIKSESDNLKVQGTYTCDLDKGKTLNVVESEKDFWFQKSDKNTTSINPPETSILKIYSNK